MAKSATWFKSNKKSCQINSKTIYIELYSEISKKIAQGLPVSQIVSWIRREVKEAFEHEFGKEPKDGSLNNCVGRWNEFIAISYLCEIAEEMNEKSEKCLAIFSMPNSKVEKHANRISSKLISLFHSSEFDEGGTLSRIKDKQHRIIFPSPDYTVVLLEKKSNLISKVKSLLKQQAKDPGSREIYNLLKGQLQANELKAVISLKTSNRPDRRYQPSFEAAMIKAIKEATNQNWKYYMVVSELAPADEILFERAISPSSILSGEDSKLVDGVYFYQSKEDLSKLVRKALE